MDKLLIIGLLSIIFFAPGYGAKPNFQFVEEWNLWKGQHEKSYGSQLEELERHLVWLSNKKYIEQHNANSHIFGFTLAMNHFGDLVGVAIVVTRCLEIYSIVFCFHLCRQTRNFMINTSLLMRATSQVTTPM